MKNKKLFLTSLIYFITMTLFVGLRIASSLGVFDFLGDNASVAFSITVQIGIMFLVPLMLMKLFFKKNIKEIFKSVGFSKITPKSILIAILIGLIAFFLNLIVSTVFNSILGVFGYNPTTTSSGSGYKTFLQLLKGLLLVAVLPGVFEEFMHRGVLLQGYSKEIGFKRALIYSSILFGLMHLNVGQVFYAMVMGVIMGISVGVSGSVYPAMIIHFMNNGLNVYLSYAITNGVYGSNFYSGINTYMGIISPTATFITVFTVLASIVITLIILFLQLFKENTVSKLNGIKQKVERSLENEIFYGKKEEIKASEIAVVNNVLVENLKPMLPDFSYVKSPLDVFIPKSEKDNYKPTTIDQLFLYASLFLGVIITIFTFIWGVL